MIPADWSVWEMLALAGAESPCAHTASTSRIWECLRSGPVLIVGVNHAFSPDVGPACSVSVDREARGSSSFAVRLHVVWAEDSRHPEHFIGKNEFLRVGAKDKA